MATNRYFNNANRQSEQDLFESMVIEAIQIGGVDVLYIPLGNFTLDPILGEAKNVKFDKAFPIEAMLDTGQLGGGEQSIMSKFGVQYDQQGDLYISKKRFKELGVGKDRPTEGDLIYIGDPDKPTGSFINALFVISRVWYANPDWQFGKHFTFHLSIESYINSYEKMRTGKKAVDKQEKNSAIEAAFGINSAVEEEEETLLDFDAQNPFGSM